MRIAIIGGGIGGLTLALSLHHVGIACEVYEAAAEVKPLGVGISLLPHGTRELARLGLLDALRAVAVEFKEACFFNSHGQLIYRDVNAPDWPQFLIHRADLHAVLLQAVQQRLGQAAVRFGHRCVAVESQNDAAIARFSPIRAAGAVREVRADAVIGCDGIHSVVRHQFYPDEGPPVFSGINTWRGITRCHPFLSGGTHVRAGALETGKMVIYPIRNNVDAEGRQLVNWLAEVRDPNPVPVDWNRPGNIQDFLPRYRGWRFPWLDVVDMIERADLVLEFPMSDREPLRRWTFGRVTLLGDAAHAMLPRGSNGAMQAVLDARVLTDLLVRMSSVEAALLAYENERRPITTDIVLTNRTSPPDILIQTVHERTGGQPFKQVEDVISQDELRGLLERYKRLTGSSLDALARGS